jgi:hypothetical protein
MIRSVTADRWNAFCIYLVSSEMVDTRNGHHAEVACSEILKGIPKSGNVTKL